MDAPGGLQESKVAAGHGREIEVMPVAVTYEPLDLELGGYTPVEVYVLLFIHREVINGQGEDAGSEDWP